MGYGRGLGLLTGARSTKQKRLLTTPHRTVPLLDYTAPYNISRLKQGYLRDDNLVA